MHHLQHVWQLINPNNGHLCFILLSALMNVLVSRSYSQGPSSVLRQPRMLPLLSHAAVPLLTCLGLSPLPVMQPGV